MSSRFRFSSCTRLLATTILALAAFAGCKVSPEAFSGLRGYLLPGPLSGSVVRVFDGSEYTGRGGSTGLLGTGTVDARGQFNVELPDSSIGRTLIVVVDFPADDPLTAEDERAIYQPPAGGTPIRMNPSDGPWVAVVDFFDGLSAPATVSPISTAAYYAMCGLSQEIAGAGTTRWTQLQAGPLIRNLGISFGLPGNTVRIAPSMPTLAGQQPAVHVDQTFTSDSVALSHVMIQLDRAASAFAAATTDPLDDQRGFFAGLFADAADGVIDGSLHGVPVTTFAQPGAPDIIGLTADGSSKLIRFVEANGPVSESEIESLQAGASARILSPTAAVIRATQQVSTGSCHRQIVDDVDTKVLPTNGQIVITIRGRGFVRDQSLLFRRTSTVTGFVSTPVTVSSTTSGTNGQILSIRHDQIVVLSPRFDLTTTPDSLKPTTAAPMHDTDIILSTDLRIPNQVVVADQIVATLKQVLDSGVHILDTRLVRLDSPAPLPSVRMPRESQATAFTTLLPAGTDPATLSPGTDAVFALEARIYNGTSVSVSGFVIHADTDITTLIGAEVTHGNYDGAATPTVVFPSDASQSASAPSITSGATAWARIPFVVDQAAIGTSAGQIELGQPLRFAPVLSGIAAPGGNVIVSYNGTALHRAYAEAAPATADQGAVVADGSLAAAGAAVVGQNFGVIWTLPVSAASGSIYRRAEVYRVEIEQVPAAAGTSPATLVLPTVPVDLPQVGAAMALASFNTSAGSGETGMPLRITQSPAALEFILRPTGGVTGSVTLQFRAYWRDTVTRESGVAAREAIVVINPAP